MDFNVVLDNNYEMLIYNQVGMLITRKVVPAGTQQYQFDMSRLDAGMYFIMLNDGEHKVAIKKLMVTK
jgi:hypothetical protein